MKDIGKNACKKENQKTLKFQFLVAYGFLCTNKIVHPLVSKSKLMNLSKCVIFCSYTWREKLTFIYSPSLITAWKRLLVKAKLKAIMQYYENLVVCFENK